MTNYSTKIYKSLILPAIILLVLVIPSYPQTDWSLPLKLCWSLNESSTHVASDNDSKTLILFSTNSIKSIKPETGETLWENKHNQNNFSDILFFGNYLYYAESNENTEKKTLQSIDINSGLSIWKKEIPKKSKILLLSDENKILLENENGRRITINIERNRQGFSDISLSNILDLFLVQDKIPVQFSEGLIFGNSFLGNSDIIKRNLSTLIPIKQNVSIWATSDNFVGVYDSSVRKNIWLRKIGGQITDIKISGNTVYISSFDNFVYLLNIFNGKFLLKKRLDGRVTNSSEIFENKIAVSAYSSNLISIFNLKSRKLENVLTLSDAQSFAVHQAFINDKLIVATPSKVLAFSPNCK